MPGLADLIPSCSIVVEDLEHLDNDELEGRALAVFPKLALWFLRDARYTARFLNNFHHWLDTLSEALGTPNGLVALGQLFRYLTLVGREVQFERFRTTLRQMPAAEESVMTFAEQFRQKGRQEGRQEGQAGLLQKLLTLKFGELSQEHLARLHAADEEQLERYTERLLGAASLDEVLAP